MGNTYMTNAAELIGAVSDPKAYATAKPNDKHCLRSRCIVCIPQMAEIGSNLSPRAAPRGKLMRRTTKGKRVASMAKVANRKHRQPTAFRFEVDPGFGDSDDYNTVEMDTESESSPSNSGTVLDGIVLNAMPFEKGHSNLAIFDEQDSDAHSCVSELSAVSVGDN